MIKEKFSRVNAPFFLILLATYPIDKRIDHFAKGIPQSTTRSWSQRAKF